MTEPGRTDSTTRFSLVAVIEGKTFEQYISRMTVLGAHPVVLGLSATVGLINETIDEGKELQILCPRETPRRALVVLRRRIRRRLKIRLPKDLSDPRCLVLPDSKREINEVLSRFDRLIVAGQQGIVYQLRPASVPAGVPAFARTA